MTPQLLGMASVAALLAAIALGVPIAWATAAVAVAGELLLTGFDATAAQLGLLAWDTGSQFVFVTLPLFLLMGQIALRTGLAGDLYECIHCWVGHRPGGLVIAAAASNALYGAVTGNTVASIATMGPIVMPQFRKHGYDLALGAGTLASAGTLAALVPPSTLLIVYGVWSETSVGKLFLAGIVPWLLLSTVYVAVLALICCRRPELAPPGPRYAWPQRLRSLYQLIPSLAVIGFVLSCIYGGIATPSESGAIGVTGLLAVAALQHRLTWQALAAALSETVQIIGTVFAIIVTGNLFTRFLAHCELTAAAADALAGLHLPRAGLMLALCGLYLLLGIVLETFGILILSLPFVLPVVMTAGVDKLWFGVFLAVMVELAAVHPPLGIAVAVMRSVAPEVSTWQIFKGSYPFIGLALLLVLLLIAVPDLALWLPRAAK